MLTSTLGEDALRQSVGESPIRYTSCLRCAPTGTAEAHCTAGSCMEHGSRWVRSRYLHPIWRATLSARGRVVDAQIATRNARRRMLRRHLKCPPAAGKPALPELLPTAQHSDARQGRMQTAASPALPRRHRCIWRRGRHRCAADEHGNPPAPLASAWRLWQPAL
ncbi:hypothetical protein CVO74_10965 [Xanthomonas prunicola]|uniref:Uncharacterized protein n=1 Tax=Xanthomonas prunicola TaxID=2053930 RepID=A0A2N3RLJ1_9XANT|nr:hypothetical protein XpruCFBP8353_08910 [Xanthomonas prunicola]PKV21505.1 hypothetical protein CVO74_10965 [Xanthomonas prunicola]